MNGETGLQAAGCVEIAESDADKARRTDAAFLQIVNTTNGSGGTAPIRYEQSLMKKLEAKLIADTLPYEYYTASKKYEDEITNVFRRDWVVLGRIDDIDEPGRYVAYDLFGKSIFVVCDGSGIRRGFYNACKHRGCALVDPEPITDAPPGRDIGGIIRCPYHSWAYGLDGGNIRTPFLSIDDAQRKDRFALDPVPLGEWGGFLFAYFGDGAPRRSLLEQLRDNRSYTDESMHDVPAYFERYPLAELRRGGRIVYDVAANWKIILENYQECYHCGSVHPELCQVVPAFKNGGLGLNYDDGIPHKPGAVTYTMTGQTNRSPFPGLNETEKVNHKGHLIFPNMMLSASCDHVTAFLVYPLSEKRTIVAVDFLFHTDEIKKDDFDPSDCMEIWDVTDRQDWKICERVQKGMESRAQTDCGVYGEMERDAEMVKAYIIERLGL